jgi:hypothetical protein
MKTWLQTRIPQQLRFEVKSAKQKQTNSQMKGFGSGFKSHDTKQPENMVLKLLGGQLPGKKKHHLSHIVGSRGFKVADYLKLRSIYNRGNIEDLLHNF